MKKLKKWICSILISVMFLNLTGVSNVWNSSINVEAAILKPFINNSVHYLTTYTGKSYVYHLNNGYCNVGNRNIVSCTFKRVKGSFSWSDPYYELSIKPLRTGTTAIKIYQTGTNKLIGTIKVYVNKSKIDIFQERRQPKTEIINLRRLAQKIRMTVRSNRTYRTFYANGRNMTIGLNNNARPYPYNEPYVYISNSGNKRVTFSGVSVGDTFNAAITKLKNVGFRKVSTHKYSYGQGEYINLKVLKGKVTGYTYNLYTTS